MPYVFITFKFKLVNYSARIAEEAKKDYRLRRIDCSPRSSPFPRFFKCSADNSRLSEEKSW